MDGRYFVFESVALLDYHLCKMKLMKSYIKSLEQLENKRATINRQNNDNNCFQYAITVALNYNKFQKRDLQKILNMKPVNQYDIENINFSSRLEDWEKFEQNNESFALNILFVSCKSEEIKLL